MILPPTISRRKFLARAAAATTLAIPAMLPRSQPRCAAVAAAPEQEVFFQTRGVVLVLKDLRTLSWPPRAKRAGLTTLATHIFPHEVAEYIRSEQGRAFLDECRTLGLQVEHELHAMSDLLPRALFDKDPTMFPMNEKGDRVREYNLCVHSHAAVETACQSAVKYAQVLRPTTGRYFCWIDDGRPMCRCPKCRGLSDSDQALILENRMLAALRRADPRATLAHLVYAGTLKPPTQVKPAPGVFLEFAPITRRYDVPLAKRDATGRGGPSHGELLDLLDANLQVFGPQGAQALEYWLDVSRYSGWRRESLQKIPWNGRVFLDDLETYARRGIRHVTTFGAWIDADYVKRFGEPPLDEYGGGMLRWRPVRPGFPSPAACGAASISSGRVCPPAWPWRAVPSPRIPLRS